VVICLVQGADLHMVQLMPLPLILSCFSKIQIRFTFLVLAHLGSPGQSAMKHGSVCVYYTHVSVAVPSQPEPFELLVVTVNIDKDDGDERKDEEQENTDAGNQTNIGCNSNRNTETLGTADSAPGLVLPPAESL